MALKLQQEEHRQHEAESKRDKRSLKLVCKELEMTLKMVLATATSALQELKELELAHEDAIRELKQACLFGEPFPALYRLVTPHALES